MNTVFNGKLNHYDVIEESGVNERMEAYKLFAEQWRNEHNEDEHVPPFHVWYSWSFMDEIY